MKFKIILIILLSSCVASTSTNNSKSSYSSKGFAYIYSDIDFKNKVTSNKFDNNELLIGHSLLRRGTIVKVVNPSNNKFIKLKVKKKTKYPDFYKILITKELANSLEVNTDFPFIEIYELKKNKSFIASKAETFNEEKNVHNKAPVTNVKIDNISNNQSKKIKKIKKFSIVIANFYKKDSATQLQYKLTKKFPNFTNKNLYVKSNGKNNYELIAGTYNTINSLKNDYITLKEFGFEELEFKINE